MHLPDWHSPREILHFIFRSTKRIVCATLLCAHASELVHLLIDVMNADAPYTAIEHAIHIHPTLAEAVQSAVAAID